MALILLISLSSLSAQTWEIKDPQVIINEEVLDFPWAGGMQAPQFSPGDFNQDGRQDLFVFDRTADLGAIYLQEEDGTYLLSSDLQGSIPPMQHWALARDYNGDGIPDIFGQSKTVAGPMVYQGKMQDGALTFVEVNLPGDLDALTYKTSTGALVNIYTAKTDIPGIVDVDSDGDLDILSFDLVGIHVVFYRNTSVEDGHQSDSLTYVLEDACWGKFAENGLTNDIVVSGQVSECASLRQIARDGLHSGSTVGTFDHNQDGDVDLLLGDLSFENLVFLANEGSADSAYVTSFDPLYPPSQPASIRFFPAAFFIDLNNNGSVSLLAAPNEVRSRERQGIVFRYDAIETIEGTDFEYKGSGFLHNQMLDFGTEAAPCWLDVDGDGLQDMLVGSRNQLGADEDSPSSLFYFRNVGDPHTPIFQLIDSNYLKLSSFDLLGADALAPLAADMDGDMDLDLIIGNKIGKLFFVENKSSGAGFEPGHIEYPWFGIDVGFSSYPCVYDVNGDSLPDLLLGEEIGNVNYFENTGSKDRPSFESDVEMTPNDPSFGLIDTRQGLTVFGFSAPSIARLHDRDYLLVGSAPGNLLLYRIDSGKNLQPADIPPVEDLSIGKRSKGQFADIDGDGYLELVTGNSRGGIVLMGTDWIVEPTLGQDEVYLPGEAIRLYPNPTFGEIHVAHEMRGSIEVQILDLLGVPRILHRCDEPLCSLTLDDLPAGRYTVLLKTESGSVNKSLVIVR